MSIKEKGTRKPGQRLWFEYHCFESHDSGDAELWYRSHQKVTVIEPLPFGKLDDEASVEDRGGRVYLVRFADGFEGHVTWDELLDSPTEFERPDPPPPSSKVRRAIAQHAIEASKLRMMRQLAEKDLEMTDSEICEIMFGGDSKQCAEFLDMDREGQLSWLMTNLYVGMSEETLQEFISKGR